MDRCDHAMLVGKDMRMPPDHFPRDRLDYICKAERALLFRDPGVEHHLQQEVAEFVTQIGQIAPRDRVGDLIGFLDRVRRDAREILFEIPRDSRCPAFGAPS